MPPTVWEKGRQPSVGSTWDADGNKNTPINPNQNYIINLQVWWLQAWLLNLPSISHLHLAFSKVRWKTTGFQTRHPRYQGPSFWDMQVGPMATNRPNWRWAVLDVFNAVVLLHVHGFFLRIFVPEFLSFPRFQVPEWKQWCHWVASGTTSRFWISQVVFLFALLASSICDTEMSNNVMIWNVYIYIYVCH